MSLLAYQAARYTNQVSYYQSIDEQFLKGREYLHTSVTRLITASSAFQLVDLALSAGGFSSISKTFRYTTYALIPLTSVLATKIAQKRKHYTLQEEKYLTLFHGLGRTFYVASVMSSIALIRFGKIPAGLSSLLLLELDLLDRAGSLPQNFHDQYLKLRKIVTPLLGLYAGSRFTKILSSGTLIYHVFQWMQYATDRAGKEAKKRLGTPVSIDEIDTLGKCPIERAHTLIEMKPPLKKEWADATLDDVLDHFRELFDKASWDSSTEHLDLELARDNDYKNQNKIEYLTTKWEVFQANLKALWDEKWLDQLRVVAGHINKNNCHTALITLAIGGGDGCKHGILNVVGEVYLDTLKANGHTLTLEDRLALVLTLKRDGIFLGKYDQLLTDISFGWECIKAFFNNPIMYNLFNLAFAFPFGLTERGIDGNYRMRMCPFSRAFCWALSTSAEYTHYNVWDEYTWDEIYKTLTTSKLINQGELTDTIIEWLEEKGMNTSNLYAPIDEKYIKAYCVEQGILQKGKAQEKRSDDVEEKKCNE